MKNTRQRYDAQEIKTGLFLGLKIKADQVILGSWLFHIVPFALLAVLYIVMWMNDVLIMKEGEFSFLNDYSNSICFPFLFIVSYNSYALFQKWENEAIDSFSYFIDESSWNRTVKHLNISKIWRRLIGLVVAVIFSIIFVTPAQQQNNVWINELPIWAICYYFIVLLAIWYLSISCLLCIIVGCYFILKCLKYKSLQLFEPTDNHTLLVLNKTAIFLSSIVSYSTLWMLAIVLIIISDYINANKYSVYMFFYKNPVSIVVVIFLVLIGYCYIIIPCFRYYEVVEKQKDARINVIEGDMGKNENNYILEIELERIKSVSGFVFNSSSSKLTFLASIVPPLISLIIKIIST